MTVAKNLFAVRAKVADAVANSAGKQQCTLVAVSKTKPLEDLTEAYDAGQRHFGENYVIFPSSSLPLIVLSAIEWEFMVLYCMCYFRSKN